MTSLTEVYEGGVGTVASKRSQVIGTGLFVAGAAMVVGAIPIATTDLGALFGLDVYGARELAGILAGLGVPAVFVGIFAVMPANRATQATAAIGASLAIFAVTIFGYAYPYNWISNAPSLALLTTLLYSVGVLVTFWCLFIGVATFKRRNDPGGAARLKITDEGSLKVVRRESSRSPLGGIGLFGRTPDGDVETQTNEDGESDEETIVAEPSQTGRQSDERARSQPESARPASDGAGALESAEQAPEKTDPAPADGEVREALRNRGRPDSYCGNCTHFEYVRADGEITPYCDFHDDLLDDMDACQHWDANN